LSEMHQQTAKLNHRPVLRSGGNAFTADQLNPTKVMAAPSVCF
jgi:hypothetical protein